MSLYKDASLAMIPSAYKDGKLYSIRPTDGSGDFTFSRGSNLAATRVDVNGLIEKGRENLKRYSNDFSNWTNYFTTETSGQADRNGGNTAWLLEKTGSGGSIYRTHSTSGVNTFSAYVKAGTLNWVRMDFTGGGSKGYFDLQNGVVGSVTGSPIDSAIEDAGNGWYRCSITTTSVGSGAGISPAENDGSIGGTSGNIYIQDAQLEQGLVATDYIETGASTAQAGILEDMPRLDYSGGASCPSLLLEPQRTNLLPQSEYFGAWNPNNATLTANAYTSPEGYDNAYKMVTDGVNAGYIQSEGAVVVYNGTTYAFSMYFNTNSTMTGNMIMYVGWTGATGPNRSGVIFTIETGAFVANYTSGSGAVIDYDITTPDANGWYRVSFWANSTNTATGAELVVRDLNLLGDGSKYLLIYGGQFEQGSYPTSYIPTYGSSVTRSQGYGRTGFDIDEKQGVLFTEFEFFGDLDTQIMSIHNGGSRVYWIMVDGAGRLRGSIFYGGGYKLDFNSGSITLSPNTNYKAAFRYESGNSALYLDGVKVATSGQVLENQEPLNYVQLGGFWQLANTRVNFNIKQSLFFNTSLTDAELAALTA